MSLKASGYTKNIYSKNFTLRNASKAKLPSLAFASMKNAALGNSYSLSVSIIGPTEMKRLNTMYRNKNTPTDILSFPLSETGGEIFINPTYARKKSKEFGRSYENFLAFLFIHGLVHLKGLDHGSTMERIEERLRKQFRV